MTDTTLNIGRDAAQKLRSFLATNETAAAVKNAGFTLVGLGVVGAQKATQAVKAAQKTIDEKVTIDVDGVTATVKTTADTTTKKIKETLAKVDTTVNGYLTTAEFFLAPYEEKLPEAAREITAKVRTSSKKVRAAITASLTGPATTETPAAADVAETVTADESTSVEA
jgi:hypothetical protein